MRVNIYCHRVCIFPSNTSILTIKSTYKATCFRPIGPSSGQVHSLPVHFGIPKFLQMWYDVTMLCAIIYSKENTDIT